MVGDIFRQEFPESLELSGRWSQLLVEGEKQRNVIFIHRDTLSAAANIAGRTFVVLPLVPGRESTL